LQAFGKPARESQIVFDKQYTHKWR
jgi:hypothetical protein